jgi:hypothetical protein
MTCQAITRFCLQSNTLCMSMIESDEIDKTATMAELTRQIPDELAHQLEPLREQLPQLLTQLLSNLEKDSSVIRKNETQPTLTQVYNEVLDFLLANPTSQEIIAFKVSSQAQKRLQILLEKNREETLTANENTELDVYEQLEHLMILLKAEMLE